jgi:hypothetical protein
MQQGIMSNQSPLALTDLPQLYLPYSSCARIGFASDTARDPGQGIRFPPPCSICPVGQARQASSQSSSAQRMRVVLALSRAGSKARLESSARAL